MKTPFRLSQLWETPKNYKPQLDLLRCLAITLVFLTHTALIFRPYGGSNVLTELPFVVGGWSGVDLFFVLSGFLIGGQLWSEYRTNRAIDFGRFFIKRTLRIWPLYFVVLIGFILIRGSIKPEAHYADLYFLSNYLGQAGIMGSWSLAAEEQFYILLPLLLLGMLALNMSYKSGRYLALGVLLASPVIRHFWWQQVLKTHPPTVRTEIDFLLYPFHTHLDSLFMGVLLANLYQDSAMIKKWRAVGLALILSTLAAGLLRWKFKIEFNYSLIALAYGSLLWGSLFLKPAVLRFFEAKWVALFARLSFGFYLFHYQFIEWMIPPLNRVLGQWPSSLNFLVSNVFIFIVTLAAATVTYFTIEVPALNWRHRLTGKKS